MIVPDAISRCPDYLNAITLGRDEHIPLVEEFLETHMLLGDRDLKEQVAQDADKFVLKEEIDKDLILC